MERNTNYGWKEQLAVGSSGEKVVHDWLRARGNRVDDLSDLERYQREDIDILVTPDEGAHRFFAEVKTDTYDNDAVFFELYTQEHNPGALFKSRARVWYIYKSALGIIIELEPARLITSLYRGYGAYRALPVKNKKGDVRAWGVRIPISALTSKAVGGMVYYLDETNEEQAGSSDEAGLGEGISNPSEQQNPIS